MRTIRLQAVLCLLVATTLAPLVSAQTSRPRNGTTGQTQPAAEQPPVERPDEEAPQRFRYRPVFRIAQDFQLPANDSVYDVRSVLADVVIEGRVDRHVVVIMGSARIAPTAVIGGSLVVIGGSATIERGASIGEDLTVIGGTLNAPPDFYPGRELVVVGNTWLDGALRDLMPWVTGGLLLGRPIVPDLDWVWAIVAVFFLLYLLLNTVLDRPVAASADMLAERPVGAFLTGLLVMVLTVPVLVILAASVVGVVVIPFLLGALVLAGLVGKTAVARSIGRSVLRPTNPNRRIPAFLTFVLGFGVLTVAYMVPVVGLLTWGLTGLLGFGAASATFRSYMRRERPPAVPAPVPPVIGDAPQPAAADYTPVATMGTAAAAAAAPPPIVTQPPLPPPPMDLPPAAAAPVAATPAARFGDGLAQYPRATFLDRAAAFALDCILVAIANSLLDLTRYEGSFMLLLLGYHIAFWAWRGTTLGGIICSLRVVRTHGADLRPIDAIVRGLSSIFSIAALGIGCLWMLIDPESQTWHDKIAGTLVVKVPREMVLP